MKAIDMLNAAAGHMKQRAGTYDQPDGERSMRRTVAALNAVKGREVLTESDGWLLMELLKLARDQSRDTPHQDSLEDAVAYAALYGESRMVEVAAPGGMIEWRNEETPLDDSWVRHTGKCCPVSPGTAVNVRLLGCFGFGIGEAQDFQWAYDTPYRGVVVAYRIVRAGGAE